MQARHFYMRLLAVAACGPAVGCTGTVSTAAGMSDAESSATSAVVVVERSLDATEVARAEASARFVRIASSSSTEGALRAIGASLELPPRGACDTVASLASTGTPGTADDPAPSIELADVGAVSLDANGVQTGLAPRQLPDVTDVVNGVVYARAGDPALFPAGSRYGIHVAGGSDLGAFDVTATAPADPIDVRVVGEDGRGQAALTTGAPIEIVWALDGQSATDALYVDVRPVAGSGVRCVLAADVDAGDPEGLGHASVPSSQLFDEHGAFVEGTIVVHRLHREPLHARGLDGGEVRFDFSRSIAYRR